MKPKGEAWWYSIQDYPQLDQPYVVLGFVNPRRFMDMNPRTIQLGEPIGVTTKEN